MRGSTELWAKFESVGYPTKTHVQFGTLNQIILAFAKWSMSDGLYMGSQVRLILARTEPELETARGKVAIETFEAELEALMNQESDDGH